MKPRPSAPAPYHHGDLRRALIAAALALVTEEQDWTFSLREVARRAGVSQSAPYNHFADKRDLLAAVAVAGFHQLRDGLVAAVTGLDDTPDAFAACLRTYVRLGMRNPALYRLMFGPELTESKGAKRPREVAEAGGEAKSILERIIRDGATSGVFAVPTGPNGQPLALATFIAWSAVHGLTMLVIDKLTGELVPVQRAIEAAIAVQLDGVRGGARAASTRQRGAAASAVERDG